MQMPLLVRILELSSTDNRIEDTYERQYHLSSLSVFMERVAHL